MRICNLGSLNFDRVYDLPRFTVAGESVSCTAYSEFLGGKGLNQSLALARAGAQVTHAGAVGTDGDALVDCLRESGVDTSLILRLPTPSGHAVIHRVGGQNSIVVWGGANRCVTREYIDRVLSGFSRGDLLLIQNEVSHVAYAIEQAKGRGMLVAFNASPIDRALPEYPLEKVDYLLINETEGQMLAGADPCDDLTILRRLGERFPHTAVVLTLGGDGVRYRDGSQTVRLEANRVEVVDTTAAGDTFTGYFLASLAQALPVEEVLRRANAAGALAVGKKGAASSIPKIGEVLDFLSRTDN